MGHGTAMAHIDRLSLVDATALIVTLVVASRSSGTHVSRFSKAQPSLHLSNPLGTSPSQLGSGGVLHSPEFT